jgi:hypothetical protein
MQLPSFLVQVVHGLEIFMFSDKKYQKPHAKTAKIESKLGVMASLTFDGKYC